MAPSEYEELRVTASFPVIVSGKLCVPRDLKRRIKEGDSTLDDEYRRMFSDFEPNAVTLVFAPNNPELGKLIRERHKANHSCSLLFHYLHLREIDDKAPVFEYEDNLARQEMLSTPMNMHFFALSDGSEFIIIDKEGMRFLPGAKWTGKKKKRYKNGPLKGQIKPASPTERKSSPYCLRAITGSVKEVDGESRGVCGSLVELPEIWLGDSRFRRRLVFDYDTVSRFIVGDILNPLYPLTRAFDPHLSFLERDENGHNVLTDFRDISIPLVWPDWEDSRLAHLAMLQTWTESSYEGVIRFLEGMKIDSLDDFIPSETNAVVETMPTECKSRGPCKNKDRRGQCYHGDYESLSIHGPYFLFRVRRGNHEFYLLDLPFYGTSLRAYWTKEHALDDIAGGERRQRAKAHRIWKAQNHDAAGNWEALLEKRIAEHILSKTTADSV